MPTGKLKKSGKPRTPAKPKADSVRDRRIRDEIVVDAHDEGERAMGWFCYLQDTLAFPFTATVTTKRAISPLRPGDEVEILGMAPEDECAHEIFVMTRWERDGLAITLSQVRAQDHVDEETAQAVEDWAYWARMGYQF